MSATYCINGHFFYIHHDGYFAGAASYFRNMINAMHAIDKESGYGREKFSGGMAEQFLRANDGAEFTESHQIHGDTEYRYDVYVQDNDAYVTWQELNTDRTGKELLIDFINNNIDSGWYDTDTPVKVYAVKTGYYMRGTELMTYENLADLLAAKENTQSIWRKNGHDRGANWDSLESEILNLYDVMNAANDEG